MTRNRQVTGYQCRANYLEHHAAGQRWALEFIADLN